MYSFDVLKNRITVDIEDDLAKAKEFYKLNGIDLTFNTQVSDLKLPALTANSKDNGQVQYIVTDFISPKKPTILFFNANEYPQPTDGYITSSSLDLKFISLKVNEYDNNVGWVWKSICHEIMHFIIRDKNKNGYLINDPMDYMLVKENGVWVGKNYYKNDDPYAKDGNFAEAFRLLKTLEKPMKKYKYFSDKEIKGVNPEFVQILDQSREIAGVPFPITSGFRTKEQNEKAGGVPNSAHTKGLAVDIQCTDNIKRQKMLWGLMQFRDKLFIEVAGRHLHVDMDSSIHAMGSVYWGNDPT